MSVFARFSPRLQEAIVPRLRWASLRPVQEQISDWAQRPLSPSQRAYPALDVELPPHLHVHFG